MSAVLKKLVIALLTDKKALKKIVTAVLVILVAVLMPIGAVLAIFNSDVVFDTDAIQKDIVANVTEEEKDNLQNVENTMNAIETIMTKAGFTSRTKEAQVLYALALSPYSGDSDFVSKLVYCFEVGQTDEELISAVNTAFGVEIKAEDFTLVMSSIRAVYLDISEYRDPTTKNNLDLVQWAIEAEKAHWGYVWGTYGLLLDDAMYQSKLSQYPNEVGKWSSYIKQHWIGGRTSDCIGLIKGYGWFNAETMEIEYNTNGMPDYGANQMYAVATEKGSIDTIPEIPGLAVWHDGHIGIYIGNGEVIEAKGTQYGVVKTPLSSGRWTHWLKIPFINYIEETEEQA